MNLFNAQIKLTTHLLSSFQRTVFTLLTGLIFLFCSQAVHGQFSDPKKLAKAAFELTYDQVSYDPSYFSIDYPNGDIPKSKGVCTDVVIRAYRKLGVDLQKLVHEDMLQNFSSYPNNWNLSKTDKNIDHRRVPNLMRFFERNGSIKSLSRKSIDYQPGDIVCWRLSGAITHIGIVSDKKASNSNRYQIIHNIGNGQVLEDALFDFQIIGHYSF